MQARYSAIVFLLLAALAAGGCRAPDPSTGTADSGAARAGASAAPATHVSQTIPDTAGVGTADVTAAPPDPAPPSLTRCDSLVARALARAREHLNDFSAPPPGEPPRPRRVRRELFDFEVSRRAELLDATSGRPPEGARPEGERLTNTPPMLVMVVVDTSGRIDPAFFKVLRGADGSIPGSPQDSVSALAAVRTWRFRTWRFRPALVGRCRVRQILQLEMLGGRGLGTS